MGDGEAIGGIKINHRTEAVGKDYPLLVKMNSQDDSDGGLSVDDSIAAAGQMVAAGLDAVELSGGLLTASKLSPSRPNINAPEKEAYFQDSARTFKKTLDVPLILVGGIRSMDVAEKLLDEKTADYLAISRPLIREPDLVKRWQARNRKSAKCISCNLCLGRILHEKPVACVQKIKLAERRQLRRKQKQQKG